MKNKNNIFIFDIDGTLTEPRKVINNFHYGVFLNFIIENEVYLVTGSDYKKAKEQLDDFILDNVSGVFTCMANALHIKGKEVYNNKIEYDKELIHALKNIRKNSKYPYDKFNNFIEKRSGMINFSVLGREADHENRKKYNKWDKKNKEREIIVKSLSNHYSNYEFVIGGEISIDIIKKTKDKSQCLDWLNIVPETLCSFDIPFRNVVFFGDKTKKGGNDYSISKKIKSNGGISYNVSGPQETFKIIYEKYI